MHNPLNRIPLEPVPSDKTLTCWRGHSIYFQCPDCTAWPEAWWSCPPIPPTPHAPNWRYTCPHCRKAWEMAERCEDFRQVCRDCILVLLGGA